ncbi:hypothetical protein [Aureibacter tunicatorum]|uniref:Lipoprotein n=1 Tax=Aureibacter tunicatorum TaxID=866807 RepID=A0AAE4BT53_9BACT|nr:hypothetical protein [Aureibacter tunicatorum]MDR6239157.1 hypothetical protein [Aureibacter tunicatorum]BDD04917.1 hypothetical protein AUTU_24000 [Aureibacter tunicatorum]
MNKAALIYLTFLFLQSCSKLNENKINSSLFLQKLSEKENRNQIFKINPKKDTIITGKSGTKLYIKANSFKNTQNQNTPIELNLKEIYKKSDMVLNQLSTTSDNKLLESSGMIYLDAFQNGQKLSLKDNSPIKIHFVKQNDQNEFRLFNAVTDSTGINWEIDPENHFDTLSITKETYKVSLINYGPTLLDIYQQTLGVTSLDTIILNDISFKERKYISQKFDSAYSDEIKKLKTNGNFVYEDFVISKLKDPDFDTYYFSPSIIMNIDTGSNGQSNQIQIINPLYLSTLKLGWINCDRFINEENLGNMRISLPKSTTNQTITCYLIFDNYNSIMAPAYFSSNHFINIPIGSHATAIAIGFENNQLYYAEKSIKVNHKENLAELKLKKIEEKEFLTKLAKFNSPKK